MDVSAEDAMLYLAEVAQKHGLPVDEEKHAALLPWLRAHPEVIPHVIASAEKQAARVAAETHQA